MISCLRSKNAAAVTGEPARNIRQADWQVCLVAILPTGNVAYFPTREGPIADSRSWRCLTPQPLPAPAQAPEQKKTSPLAWAGIAVFMAGLLGLLFGFRHIFGSEAGGACSSGSDSDCKPDHTCIGKKCYRECETDADCTGGWRCGGTTVSESPDGNAAKGFKLKSVNICFSPEKMAAVDEKERLEADKKKAQDAARALDKKKFDTSMKVIVLLTTKAPQLSTEEFEAAWNEIPEADRKSKSVDQLAQRIVKAKRP